MARVRAQNGSTIRYGARGLSIALLLTLVAALLALTPVPGSVAAADEVSVTWPSVTAFNPEAYDYMVEVDHQGTERIRLDVGYSDPTSGETFGDTIDIAVGEPTLVPLDHIERSSVSLFLYLCNERDGCWPVAQHRIFVASKLFAVPEAYEGVFSPRLRILGYGMTEYPMDVTWSVAEVDEPSTPVATGQVVQARRSTLLGPIPELASGRDYLFRLAYRLQGPNWGDLRSEVEYEVSWDSEPPEATFDLSVSSSGRYRSANLPERTLYPYPDDLGDEMYVAARLTGKRNPDIKAARGWLEVWDPRGVLVRRVQLEDHFSGTEYGADWSGRVDGRPARAGVYRVRITVMDRVGNERVKQWDLRVSSGKLAKRTSTYRVRPAASLFGESVGSCTDLRSPARSAWPGSLAYRSDRTCAQRGEWGVSTSHAIWIDEGLLEWGPATFGVALRGAPLRGLPDYNFWAVRSPDRPKTRWNSEPTPGRSMWSGIRFDLADHLWDRRRGMRLLPVYFSTGGGNAYDLREIEIKIRHTAWVGE